MASQFAMAQGPTAARRWLAVAIVLAMVIALGIAGMAVKRTQDGTAGIKAAIAPGAKPGNPPAVEPLVLDTSKPDEARRLNAAIPFSTAPNPAARPFHFSGDAGALDRATDCLAAAMLYEAGDDPTGERAVGQVVLNRLRHPAFPKTVCGVVFQGQERVTGCQFTFTCDGAMARIPSDAAWTRARGLAGKMLAGDVYAPVGYSTHYHTDWVIPYWSGSLDKVAAVDTHLFFRWQGWWGTPAAFVSKLTIAAEPLIAKLAFLSPAHRASDDPFAMPALPGSLIDDERAPLAVGPELIGKRIGPGRLTAIESGGNGFIMTVDKGDNPAGYSEAAARLCSGRAQCRLLAWTDARATPKSFPVAEASLSSMSFSYIRIKESGLERTLYNCAEFPATPRIKCMARIPAQATHRLLADEKAGRKSAVPLPDSTRPLADIKRSELVPTRRIETTALQKPVAVSAGAAAPATP